MCLVIEKGPKFTHYFLLENTEFIITCVWSIYIQDDTPFCLHFLSVFPVYGVAMLNISSK